MRALLRWLSLRAYGLVTSPLFGATTAPRRMRARFERFGRNSRDSMRRRFPNVVFEDQFVDRIAIESVRAVATPARVILYLHGGGFFMGSPASYRRRTTRLSYRFHAEVFVPEYRLAPEDPHPAALDDALRVREAARLVGTDVRVHVDTGMQHDWPLTLPWLDESRVAWKVMESFVEERTNLATRAAQSG